MTSPIDAPAPLPGADHIAVSQVTTTGWSAELRAMFTLAWPLVVAQLAQNALFTTDVIMMGWLGPEKLAAGTLGAAFVNTFLIGGIGLVGAVAPLVAQAIGARDIKGVRRTVRQGLWVSLLLSILSVTLLLNGEALLLALGQTPELSELGAGYITTAAILFFPALALIVLRSFLSAMGDTKIILWITIVGALVNVLGNWCLMFGNLGFPRLELRGAAISTTLVNALMFGLLLAYVLTHRKYRRYYILVRFWKPDWARFFSILRVGGPIGLMVLAEVGLFAGSSILMGWLGTDELAAHAVALQLSSLAFMVPLGLSQAATVRVGLAYGRQDPEGIRKAGWSAVVVTLGFMLVTAATFLLAPVVLVGLFLNPAAPENAQALALAAVFLGIAGLFQVFDGAQVSAAGALRGLSDTKWPMVVALVGYWGVGLPVALALGFWAEWGGLGVWVGLAVGLAFVAIILVARFALRERLGLLPA